MSWGILAPNREIDKETPNYVKILQCVSWLSRRHWTGDKFNVAVRYQCLSIFRFFSSCSLSNSLSINFFFGGHKIWAKGRRRRKKNHQNNSFLRYMSPQSLTHSQHKSINYLFMHSPMDIRSAYDHHHFFIIDSTFWISFRIMMHCIVMIIKRKKYIKKLKLTCERDAEVCVNTLLIFFLVLIH